MNEWATRTLDLVNNQDYLDRLQQVYPHEEGEREVNPEVLDSIRHSDWPEIERIARGR